MPPMQVLTRSAAPLALGSVLLPATAEGQGLSLGLSTAGNTSSVMMRPNELALLWAVMAASCQRWMICGFTGLSPVVQRDDLM